MPFVKKAATKKAIVAEKKKSEKQDERQRKREFKKQRSIAKDYQSKEEIAFSSFLAEIGLIIKYMDGETIDTIYHTTTLSDLHPLWVLYASYILSTKSVVLHTNYLTLYRSLPNPL